MLKKLLKYEFKAVSRTVVPLISATLALSVLSAIVQTINTRFFAYRFDDLPVILSAIFGVVTFFAVVAILASPFILVFILLHRYYKSFFGDEGYLTFTLPVSTGKLLTAKLISGFFWTIVGALATLISLAVLVLFGTAGEGLINSEITKTIEYGLRFVFMYFGKIEVIIFIIELAALCIIAVISQIMLYYLAITIGSIIARKHKVLTSIGVYFGINMLTSVLFQAIYMPLFTAGRVYSAHVFVVILILMLSILAVVSYLLTRKLLEDKLNLE